MEHINKERYRTIRKRLKALGISINQAAASLPVSPATVTLVGQGFRRSRRVQAHLADLLDTTPEELFPERYSKEDAI